VNSDREPRKRRHIEREFGVPFAGEILDPTQWTQTALKKLPAEGLLDLVGLRQRPVSPRQRGLAAQP
jgi:hypothetical protein